MKRIITIGRLYGAGGGEIGRRVAEALNIEYYDRDMIMKTAMMDPRLDSQMVLNWEKKPKSKWGLAHTLHELYNRPVDDNIWNAQKKTIMKMANEESCVIVGRNANYILEEYDHTLRVFVHAGFNWRVDRMAKLSGMDRDEVASEVKDIDKSRKKNCEYYTGRPFGDAAGFDLCINTEKLGIDEAVKLILEAVDNIK